MGVSHRRYASMHGVSDKAVRKAIASGRIWSPCWTQPPCCL